MEIIFKKKQLRLAEDSNRSQLPPKTVMNSEGDDDTSSLANDISQINTTNTDRSDIVIPTTQYTSKSVSQKNKNVVTTIPNSSSAPQQAAKIINTSNSNDMPAMIRITNGLERSGNLIETVTFSKKELNNFLKSI